MKTNKVNLGKVCVTIDKDYWDINKDYDKLVIVEVENAYATYISRQPVPHGIDIENKEYWCLFSRYNKNYLANEGIFNVSKYLKIKDIVSNVVPLTLTEAVAACPSVVKNAGQIITFINNNKEWQRYQYQGYTVENWNQLTLWKDLNNVSEDIPVSEDVMTFNITEYMPGGIKYKQPIWAGIYTIDGITPVSQYRLIFGCDKNLGDVEDVDMETSDTLAILDINTNDTTVFSYILFVGNSTDGYRYQTAIDSDRNVPDWISKAFGNNSSYVAANIASLERKINVKLGDKSSIIRVDDYLTSSKEMPNGYFMFEQQPVSQTRVLYDNDAYLLFIQAAVDGTGTMYFVFENFDEYYESWRYLNQYTEENCPNNVLEAFGLNVATSNNKGMMSATDKSNLDGSFKNVSYNSTTKKLIFTKNDNTTKSLDATPFIKDGMVNSVSIDNGYLVITFNTDSGKENIRILLTDVFNPANYYTKQQTDGLLGNKVDKSEMSVVPGTGANADKTTITLKQGVSATVLTTHQDISEKADKMVVIHSLNGADYDNNPIITKTKGFYSTTSFLSKPCVLTSTTSVPCAIEFSMKKKGTLQFMARTSENSLSSVKTWKNGSLMNSRIFEVEIGDVIYMKSVLISTGTDAVHSVGVEYLNLTEVYNLSDIANNKVDKEEDKGLSSNDYTDEDKEKLGGIAQGATANIGTITGITMNGSSKGTSGVVNLGTVVTSITMNGNTKTVSNGTCNLGTVLTSHQDISNKEDKPTVTTTLPSGTTALTPNTIYKPSNSLSNKTFYLPSPSATNQGKCIIIKFTATNSVINFSGSVTYLKGAVTAWEANTSYVVSCLSDGSTWLLSVNKTSSTLN